MEALSRLIGRGGSREPKGGTRCEFDPRAVVTSTCHPPPVGGGTAVRFGPLPTGGHLAEDQSGVPSSLSGHRWCKKGSNESGDHFSTLKGLVPATVRCCEWGRQRSFPAHQTLRPAESGSTPCAGWRASNSFNQQSRPRSGLPFPTATWPREFRRAATIRHLSRTTGGGSPRARRARISPSVKLTTESAPTLRSSRSARSARRAAASKSWVLMKPAIGG